MSYINTQSGEYPVSESDIRAAHPDYSPPVPFSPPAGYEWVFPTPQPPHDEIAKQVREIAPGLSAKGQYEQRWEVVSRYATQAEEDAAVAAHLAGLKAAKNAEINAARLAANFSAFIHQGKAVACDQLSRSDIDGTNGYISLYGVMPPGWPGGWKAIDNTYITISTVDQWRDFYRSMFEAGNANFSKAQALKTALNAATTAQEVAAIAW